MASSGGGWVRFSNKNWEVGIIFTSNFFRGDSVLKHYTSLKTIAPPWDVINDRSLVFNYVPKITSGTDCYQKLH